MALLNSNGYKTLVRTVKVRMYHKAQNIEIFPPGIVRASAGTITPEGWLLCDGSAISRTTYAKLFAAIGTIYGVGDGSTTFNLPDLTDRFIQGFAGVDIVKTPGVPNITGQFSPYSEFEGSAYADMAFRVYDSNQYGPGAGFVTDYDNCLIGFDASRSNAIYGKSMTVQPPAITMRYIIKY